MNDAATSRPVIRLDKWLWYARFFKTRSLAARQVQGGHVRVNGQRVSKPSSTVGPGDVLTFVQGRNVRVVEVLACGERRGPAPEAQALYDDRSPEPAPRPAKAPGADRVGGRPTKKDRRDLEKTRPPRLE